MRRRRILFAGCVARMEVSRLPKYMMFGELIGGADCVGRREKEWMVCVCPGPFFRAFCINADQRTTVVRVEGEWRKTVEQVAERSVAKWIAAEKARAEPRHAVVCPNVTGRIKERKD